MTTSNLWDKLKGILSSIRFWILFLGWIVSLLKLQQLGNLDLVNFFTSLQVFIGAVVGLGTLDSLAVKSAGTNATK